MSVDQTRGYELRVGAANDVTFTAKVKITGQYTTTLDATASVETEDGTPVENAQDLVAVYRSDAETPCYQVVIPANAAIEAGVNYLIVITDATAGVCKRLRVTASL